MKPFKRLAFRLGASGAALALSAVGLVALAAPPASATTIAETFAGAGPTAPLELQLSETINQPASIIQGNNITIQVSGNTTIVPTAQSIATVNFINKLHTIVPVPAQSTYVGNIVGGNWAYYNAGLVPGTDPPTNTGALVVTECTAPAVGTCDAVTTPTPTFLGPTATTTGTTYPYVEASTGTDTFAAGGTLVIPSWSFDVNASGHGSIVSTVSEFDTNANVNIPALGVVGGNVPVIGYPAVADATCLSAAGCSTGQAQPAYNYQPIATTTILSPPAPPVLQPQTGNVSAGQCTQINPLNGATDTGSGDAADPTSVTVVPSTGPANGTATVGTGTGSGGNGIPVGNIQYCNTGGTAPTDQFNVTAADTLGTPPSGTPKLVSAAVTETINISYNQCSAGSGTPGTSAPPLGQCSLHQEIVLPVTPGQIILSQANGLPLDYLGSSFCATPPGTVPGITLNGNVQAACGVVSPMTITNATGLDSGWTLTGEVSDFVDPGVLPAPTCDTPPTSGNPGTYNNHCIPGGNLSWEPAGAVSHSIVPGDTAQVTAGPIVLPPNPEPPVVSLNPILQGSAVQSNPVVEPAPNPGLHNTPQTMCFTNAGQSGGTFVCAAGLELVIPASIAEPAVGAFGAPAYQASLTLTLS